MAIHDRLTALQKQVSSVLLGKQDAIRKVLIALLARGHVLLEDVPGVGKTLLSRSVARGVDCTFSRIQMTPDLLPSDILGVSIYDTDAGEFTFKRGPIFANIILADEVNRTTPRTQSALLEAMNESQVTNDGQTYPLGPPFMVIATQNPYEFEGTYFLPENQLDRFMIRIRIGHPDKDTERDILHKQPARTLLETLRPVMNGQDVVLLQDKLHTVRVDEAIINYVLDITEATRRSEELTVGLSPRASLSMMEAARASAMLDGRDYAVPDDVKDLASAICAHRLRAKSFAHDGAASAAEGVFEKILETIPVPQ
ncbi:MAG: AAA domain-containing protein [Bacteroidetes bacterium]|jgi:MoxR-like ATPase|nr:AAA domain-containing protein [Bacteroidota bacterium]